MKVTERNGVTGWLAPDGTFTPIVWKQAKPLQINTKDDKHGKRYSKRIMWTSVPEYQV